MPEKDQEASEAEGMEIADSPINDSVEGLVEIIDAPEVLDPVMEIFGGYPWVKGILIFVFFILIAKLLTWVFLPIIRRLAARTASHVDDKIIMMLKAPLFWTVTLIGLLVASTVSSLGDQLNNILLSIVTSVLVFLWMLFAIRLSKLLLQVASSRASDHAVIRPQTLPLFTNLFAITFFIFAVYFIFQAWHIDMTAWLASAGIIGIAVGFAAKDTLANLFSGVFIMADTPYKIGDYIVLDDGTGLRGKVTSIGIRSTRLLTRDDVEVTIPNAIMGNSKVVNESGGPYPKYRIRVAVGVAYGVDIDKVKSILLTIAEENEAVCHDPEPRVRFRTFGASSLDFELLCWVDNPELRGRVVDMLNSTIYKLFLQEGVEIPYSKQDLYIKEFPGQTD
ncbi:MAG: mechanosensitive ion channel family protein [Candidatus Thiodiazotropha lotti]|uniref:mechanosensitive ion channel family protein n=3 Tax=Candidatus Thiodiazotropha endoloripes TaxID=1818881 RepID=UPI000AD805D8|nr:mechanosensitive ion channel family protein [Candidatus Thiodiazotropha endoloripes]MCG7899419.1 mechanosensitive ion channel family protein [Candidatus Thiodiazotropha weberae]MCG7992106.1 mechanosensitive ion channel family protein [Candidatus Thiodiazotropha lotti]MCG7903977.1 mechanosensitive ion channel family protein [Candidatus Thiodiazotropha weberae]MCG7998610.1 mechanosensitive ion channel family protein [Candidatus Thiodiazotropha lotti]MCW4183764.1 mechanosensitive ion channel f